MTARAAARTVVLALLSCAPLPASQDAAGAPERAHGGIVRGPAAERRIAIEFTGHEFAEGGATILDELARRGARASFFLTGDFLRTPAFAPLIRRIVAEGHYLGPHSDKHLLYCDWVEREKTLVNFTPGTRSNADYTGEADRNFVASQRIYDSILAREREDPHGLNGYLLLLHVGAGPGRADKMHDRLGSLLDALTARGYRFVRVDDLLR